MIWSLAIYIFTNMMQNMLYLYRIGKFISEAVYTHTWCAGVLWMLVLTLGGALTNSRFNKLLGSKIYEDVLGM